MNSTGSKAEFSRKYGYSKAAVTQFDKAKKLVYVAPGIIDFEASIRLINDTSDPARIDVKHRHAMKRGETEISISDVHGSFQKARAIKEKYLAMMARLEFEKEEGLLIEKSYVEKVIFERGRQFRDGVITASRRIAPKIAGKESVKEIEELINAEMRQMLHDFAKLPLIE